MLQFDDAFNKQLIFNFSQRHATAKEQTAADRRASRSAVVDIDRDSDAFNVSTTDFRQLSRYIMEDLIRARSGDSFLICIAKDFDTSGVHPKAATEQRKEGIGGDVVRISGRDFYCLKGHISLASQNEELRLGMTRGAFEKSFHNEGGGFGLDFEKTNERLTFSWRSIVHSADDVMFFGRQFEGSRSFDSIFKGKKDIEREPSH